MVSSGGMNYAQAALSLKGADSRVVSRDKAVNRVFAGFLRCPWLAKRLCGCTIAAAFGRGAVAYARLQNSCPRF